VLYLSLLLVEPLYYIVSYARNRKGIVAHHVMGGHTPALFAAVALKAIYRSKIAFLIHDADSCRPIWKSKIPFAMRIYYLLFTCCLRYVDHVTVVSKPTANELSAFYQHLERISLLWGE